MAMKTELKVQYSERLNRYTLDELRATIIKAEKLIEMAERDPNTGNGRYAPTHKRAYRSEIRIELITASISG